MGPSFLINGHKIPNQYYLTALCPTPILIYIQYVKSPTLALCIEPYGILLTP